MPKCSECGKILKTFDLKPISDWKGNRFCSLGHKEKFTQGINEDKNKEKEMISKGMIKEIKVKCNQCKHVWHYLESDEKKLRQQAVGNLMVGGGMCCNPFGALFLNKSIETSREADKFKKCPQCNSIDITKTPVYHERKG